MKTILREEKSGVAEVVGTILILAMTVVLFSVVILWVSSVPTPVAQTRVDLFSQMSPMYDLRGLEIGVNLTLTHEGGEPLQPVSTLVYVTAVRGTNPPTTEKVTLHLYNGRLANPNGLLDGRESIWNIGERWAYQSFGLRSSDAITVTIVDTTRGVVVWSGLMNPKAGTRPPIFTNIWTDGVWATEAPDPVQAGLGFYLATEVMDFDGDLNPLSVYATITAWYGSGTSCAGPLQMKDDGVAPDRVAGDHIFTLGGNVCMSPPYPPLTWAGTVILLNATDLQRHQATDRFVLNVIPPTGGGGGGGFNLTTIPSELWQYIGFVQIRTGEVWVSNLSNSYAATNTYQPFRVLASQLNGNGGALFHFKMANHGNTTIFVDGWTEAFFQNTQSSSGFAMYVVAACNPLLAANAGGAVAYPGTTANINDFQYARAGSLPAACSSSAPRGVFDIDPFNQEKGGVPYTVLVYNLLPFGTGRVKQWQSASYFMSILVSGMSGPVNYTYSMLAGGGPNPYGCPGLGPAYNPHEHLLDPIVACRTQWYAQVIPFIGMVVY